MNQNFQSLHDMGQEYRRNTNLLELRIRQLQFQLKNTQCLELRRRLKHRIGMLHVLVNEGRKTGFYLQNYYHTPEETVQERVC